MSSPIQRKLVLKYNSGDCLLGQDVKLTPLVFTPGGRIGTAAEDHFRDLSQEIASIRAPFKPEEQRAALANSIYRGIRTRMAVAVQRGIAVQILTFGLERRRRDGAALRRIPPGHPQPGCTNQTNRVRQQVARFGRSRATWRQRQRVGAVGCVTWRQRRQRPVTCPCKTVRSVPPPAPS